MRERIKYIYLDDYFNFSHITTNNNNYFVEKSDRFGYVYQPCNDDPYGLKAKICIISPDGHKVSWWQDFLTIFKLKNISENNFTFFLKCDDYKIEGETCHTFALIVIIFQMFQMMNLLNMGQC